MDSTGDWPKDFQELKTIDALLRCPICYEYMDAAVSLRTCLHSFCSVCVRRYLSKYQKDCPQCHQVAAESDLVANRGLGELISKFRNVRGRLLDAVRVASSGGASSSPLSGTSTDVARPRQPVAVPASAAASTGRRSGSGQANALAARTSSAAPRRVTAGDDLPNTYVFSEPWVDDDAGAAPATARGSAVSNVSACGGTRSSSSALLPGGGVDRVSVLSDSQDAAVPLPPMSMPDTQQILNDDSFGDGVVLGEVDTGAASQVDISRLSSSDSASNVSVHVMPAPASLAGRRSAPAVAESSGAAAVASSTAAQDLADRVPCPVCSALIPSRSVNSHLDRCLSHEGQKPRLHVDTAAYAPTTAAVSSSLAGAVSAPLSSAKRESLGSVDLSSRPQVHGSLKASASNTAAVSSNRKPMARLVYTLLADKQLRKHMKDCGLPTHGSKQAMIKRHQEFVLRYNADADSINPRTAVEIARALEEEERARGAASAPLGRGTPASSQKPLRFDGTQSADNRNTLRQEYAVQHQNQFSHLIDEVRHRRRTQQSDPLPPPPSLSPQSGTTPGSRRSKSHASASPVVRASPRSAKTRSSPRGQPPAKKRRSARKQPLALSDEEAMPSGGDTDVDPHDFLPHDHVSQKKRRSSRRRTAVRRSYLELPSTDDEDFRPDGASNPSPEERLPSSRALFELSDSAEEDPNPLPRRMELSDSTEEDPNPLPRRMELSDSTEPDSRPATRRRGGQRRSNGHAELAMSDDDFRPFNNESLPARTTSPPSRRKKTLGRRAGHSSASQSSLEPVDGSVEHVTEVRSPESVRDDGGGDNGDHVPEETRSTGRASHRDRNSDASDTTAEYGVSDVTAEYIRSDDEDDNTSALRNVEASADDPEELSQCDSLPLLMTDGAGGQRSSESTATDQENLSKSSSFPPLSTDTDSADQDLSQSDSQPLLAAAIENPDVENGHLCRDSFFGSLSSAPTASLCGNAMAFDDNAETQFPGASSPDSSGVTLQHEVNGLSPQILAEDTQTDYSPDRKMTRRRRAALAALQHNAGDGDGARAARALHTTCIEETQGFASPPGATATALSPTTLTRRSLRCRR